MRTDCWYLLSLVLAAGLLVAGCTGAPKSPEISVEGVSVSSISLSSISLDVALLINNPNPFGITFSKLAFDVYYQEGSGWEYLAHGEKTAFTINPGENRVTVPVTVSSADLLGSLGRLVASGNLTIQIRGSASPEFIGISPAIPFTYTTTITR